MSARRRRRGWTETEWADAEERLRSRGLLDAESGVTPIGHRERELVEDTTDRPAARLLRPLAENAADELLAAPELPARQVLGAEPLPFPSPIGPPRS
ncbi:hypothetical protein GCM10015535_52160 [Streptomyces gelaticus]|uniref:Uncharacterized protein n=1 Tax=Streptomyces gelaticus TaxID=285446 RepID=A0ABQ2W4E9_9ACTN|nr:hypothetical protein [Streptomyces gelaticus]GGV92052.1 hypothetical protein GCM10015535_52160 [Streptomyces gelaticus]